MIKIERHDEITPQLYAVFPKFVMDNFDSLNLADPKVLDEMAENYWKPAGTHLMAFDDDELVGVAHITKRTVQFHDMPLTLACLGSLTVAKNRRNEGIAHKLIEERMEIAKVWRADIAFLNTDVPKLGKLFAEFGFVELDRAYSFIGESGKLHTDKGGMIAPVASETKFQEVLDDTDLFFIGESNF